MLKIRLRRVGKRNRPYFAIVVADRKKAVKGKFIEKLGSYDPIKKTFSIHSDKLSEWRKKGAQLSDTVHNLLVKNKVISDKPIRKTVKPKPKKHPESNQSLAEEKKIISKDKTEKQTEKEEAKEDINKKTK